MCIATIDKRETLRLQQLKTPIIAWKVCKKRPDSNGLFSMGSGIDVWYNEKIENIAPVPSIDAFFSTPEKEKPGGVELLLTVCHPNFLGFSAITRREDAYKLANFMRSMTNFPFSYVAKKITIPPEDVIIAGETFWYEYMQSGNNPALKTPTIICRRFSFLPEEPTE